MAGVACNCPGVHSVDAYAYGSFGLAKRIFCVGRGCEKDTCVCWADWYLICLCRHVLISDFHFGAQAWKATLCGFDRSVLERIETVLVASRGVSRTLSSDRERSKFRASMISKRWLCIGGRSQSSFEKGSPRLSAPCVRECGAHIMTVMRPRAYFTSGLQSRRCLFCRSFSAARARAASPRPSQHIFTLRIRQIAFF